MRSIVRILQKDDSPTLFNKCNHTAEKTTSYFQHFESEIYFTKNLKPKSIFLLESQTMSKLPITLLLFLLLVANSRILTGQQQTDKQSYSTKEADKLLARYDLPNAPGLVVSIAKDGKRLYNKSVGISNLEYGIPITSSTVFHVASVSKQFTVFSILLLEKEGKLSLDDDIRTYLPEIKMEGHKITLRHLASHTSGIRDNTTLAYLTRHSGN
jgi:CubicO group peptidase (beta-lactamase class C family)